MSSSSVPPGGGYDARNQADLEALAALPPKQRGTYLEQHPDVVQRIYTSHDQEAKAQFAKLMQR